MATISLLASPKANLLQTPVAPRSHARIVKTLESEDMEPLKALNFSQLESDESDDDNTIQVTTSKLPVPLLPPAELEMGWPTSHEIQPVCQISTNTRVSTKL